MLRSVAVLLLSLSALFAQNRVPPEMLYHRIWAVVPLIGHGTPDDARRPMFVPSRAERMTSIKTGNRSGVFSYAMQIRAVIGLTHQVIPGMIGCPNAETMLVIVFGSN